MAQGQPGEAIPSLTSALQIDPTNADNLNLLGTAYLETGDASKAVTNLRSAVEFVPTGWCDPYRSLTQAYTKLSNTPEATWASAMVDLCQQQLAKAKQELDAIVGSQAATDAYLGLGMVAESQRDPHAAAAAYRQVLARDPANFNAQAGLARANDVLTAPGAGASPAPSTGPSTGGDG